MGLQVKQDPRRVQQRQGLRVRQAEASRHRQSRDVPGHEPTVQTVEDKDDGVPNEEEPEEGP